MTEKAFKKLSYYKSYGVIKNILIKYGKSQGVFLFRNKYRFRLTIQRKLLFVNLTKKFKNIILIIKIFMKIWKIKNLIFFCLNKKQKIKSLAQKENTIFEFF